MNILAFDTSTSSCSVALYFEVDGASEGQTLTAHEDAPMQHTSIILPMMQILLDSAGLTIAGLNAIAFGCGPGSFTGVRIAASLAQGLAFANNLPVIPVSSLAAAAQAAYLAHGWERMLTAVDARMNQVYWCAYQVENKLVSPLFAEELTTPQTCHAVAEGEWYGIGDGWSAYRSQLVERLGKEPRAVEPERTPTAEAVLCLAKERFKRGDWVSAQDALPVYLR